MASTVIIVPCYNEARRLQKEAFRRFVDEHADLRFLFVDDGSTDTTATILNQLQEENPSKFTSLLLERNSGKGEAVRQGFLEAFELDPAYVGFWDADLATPLDEIPAFQQLLDSHPEIEIVFGARVNLRGRHIERKATRHYLGRVFATAAVGVLGIPIYDTQCGAKLFRMSDDIRRLFEEPFISQWIFDVEIIARLIRNRRGSDLPPAGDVIYEHPLSVWRDIAGSKIRYRDFIVAASDLVRIYFRYIRP